MIFTRISLIGGQNIRAKTKIQNKNKVYSDKGKFKFSKGLTLFPWAQSGHANCAKTLRWAQNFKFCTQNQKFTNF